MHRYIIVGYGGIGRAIVSQLLAQGHEVFVISHTVEKKTNTLNVECVDLTNESCIDKLCDCLTQFQPTHIINTIGILHNTTHQPEKNITQFDPQWFSTSISVNVMPTVHLAKALQHVLTRHSELKLLVISARVSSIADNKLGGWYSYRMSKACLNMLVKNISIEWHRQYPDCMIVAYHPGTVDTLLSKPFQANVPDGKLFLPEQASEYLLNVYSKLDVKDSGNLYDWQGQKIEF